MTARLEPCEKRVACPVCFAQPGYACRGPRGILTEPHRQRAERLVDLLNARDDDPRRQPA